MLEILIGATSALAGTVVAGWLSLVRDSRAGERQESRDRAQRRHEVIEHRFDARREAYVGFAAAIRGAEAGTLRFIDEYGTPPGEIHEDLSHPGVDDALAMMLIVGPAEVIAEAERAAKYLFSWAYGVQGATHEDAQAAFSAYNNLARKTLKFDEAA